MTTYTLDNEKKNLLYWSIQNTSEFTSQADLKYIIQYQLLSVNFHYHGHQLEHIYSKERGETEMHRYNNNSNDIQQEHLNRWRKEKLYKKYKKKKYTQSHRQKLGARSIDCKRNTQRVKQTYTPWYNYGKIHNTKSAWQLTLTTVSSRISFHTN